MTHYDGTTDLKTALAALCSCSVKNHNKLSELTKQAKDALEITINARLFSSEQRLAVWQWHKDRLNNVELFTQSNSKPVINDDIETLPTAEPIEPVSRESVELFTQSNSEPVINDDIETLPTAEPIEPVSLGNVELFTQQDNEPTERYSINALVRIAFFTSTYGELKRQYIALDGFYVNALMLAAGIDKKGVSKWIQRAVDNWKAFDDKLPITKQVKLLIIRELEKQLSRARHR
jgi:hypothetical protein